MPLWIWGSFFGLILGFLALDLGVFHRHAHEVKMKEALTWSAIWIGIACAFGAALYFYWPTIQPNSAYTPTQATQAYFAGYLIEKALSVDNIFVFLLLFSYFKVPAIYQHRVLFWGIIGALIFRTIFIAAGAALLERFFWTMIIFGVFLIFTGIKMVAHKDKEMDPSKNPMVNLINRIMPVTKEYHGQNFFVNIDGKRWATPLFVCLMAVEFTDVIFAVDSIPAIFAITADPFIVLTSNVFAILGLRALFFALAGLMKLFHYLSYGLAAILVFVGGKMLYSYAEKVIYPEWTKFDVGLSLGIIGFILTASIVASILKPPADSNNHGAAA
ncbi:MAG: TerC family protein [Fimbriimonadaceae bacterium]